MEKRIERNPFGDNHSVNVQGTSKTVGRCEHPLVCRSRSHNALSKQLEGSANREVAQKRPEATGYHRKRPTRVQAIGTTHLAAFL